MFDFEIYILDSNSLIKFHDLSTWNRNDKLPLRSSTKRHQQYKSWPFELNQRVDPTKQSQISYPTTTGNRSTELLNAPNPSPSSSSSWVVWTTKNAPVSIEIACLTTRWLRFTSMIFHRFLRHCFFSGAVTAPRHPVTVGLKVKRIPIRNVQWLDTRWMEGTWDRRVV